MQRVKHIQPRGIPAALLVDIGKAVLAPRLDGLVLGNGKIPVANQVLPVVVERLRRLARVDAVFRPALPGGMLLRVRCQRHGAVFIKERAAGEAPLFERYLI